METGKPKGYARVMPLIDPAPSPRREFLKASSGLGIAALAWLLNQERAAADTPKPAAGGLPELPHFIARAKRVIYLFQSGAPSQMDLFDYKPKLADLRGT